MNPPESVTLPVRFRTIADPPAADVVFAAIYADRDPVVWLDSNAEGDPLSRFSFMADVADPLSYAVRYRSQTREVDMVGRRGRSTVRQSVFDFLKAALVRERVADVDLPFPFRGGFVGYLGYELKGECDGQYVHAPELPDAFFLHVHRFLAFDHQTATCFAVAVGDTGDEEQWLDDAAVAVRAAQRRDIAPPPQADDVRFTLDHTPDAYVDRVAQAIEEIRAGESYQVCLTNRIRAPFTGDAHALYSLLRQHNPAPFSAFVRTADFSILQTSPERFLSIDTAGAVEARPIKGTTRRSADPVEDLRLADELSRSDKNRAEHMMIVDVLRNDLGRVARFGSVRVPELMAIETHPTVHHIVSTVRASLAEQYDAIDCIRAAFPGGSMTGAPKLRTMEILDRLETSARGVYSGALGYLSIGGAVDLSIVIRTAVVANGSISIGVGGGVVATSDPQDEFDEAMLKGAALMRAIREYQRNHAPRPNMVAAAR
ncbi:MAG: aminodeoxychorismate synthase component I [Acidobacteria bacterium]|nr:aminodeoxychorismate synthase component I [Acidobacteriota bacterium]